MHAERARAEFEEAEAARRGSRRERASDAVYWQNYRKMKLRGGLFLAGAVPAGLLTGAVAGLYVGGLYYTDFSSPAELTAIGLGFAVGTGLFIGLGTNTLIKAERYKKQNLSFAIAPKRGGAQIGARFSF
jgi:hypothetical protein